MVTLEVLAALLIPPWLRPIYDEEDALQEAAVAEWRYGLGEGGKRVALRNVVRNAVRKAKCSRRGRAVILHDHQAVVGDTLTEVIYREGLARFGKYIAITDFRERWRRVQEVRGAT